MSWMENIKYDFFQLLLIRHKNIGDLHASSRLQSTMFIASMGFFSFWFCMHVTNIHSKSGVQFGIWSAKLKRNKMWENTRNTKREMHVTNSSEIVCYDHYALQSFDYRTTSVKPFQKVNLLFGWKWTNGINFTEFDSTISHFRKDLSFILSLNLNADIFGMRMAHMPFYQNLITDLK